MLLYVKDIMNMGKGTILFRALIMQILISCCTNSNVRHVQVGIITLSKVTHKTSIVETCL